MRAGAELRERARIVSVGNQNKLMTRLIRGPGTDLVERRGSHRDNAVTGFHRRTFYLGRTGSDILIVAEREFLREVCEPLITYISNSVQMGKPPLEFVH